MLVLKEDLPSQPPPGVMAGTPAQSWGSEDAHGKGMPTEGAGVRLAQGGPGGSCSCLSPCPCGAPWRSHGGENKDVAPVVTLQGQVGGPPSGGSVAARQEGEGAGWGPGAPPWPVAALGSAVGRQGLAPVTLLQVPLSWTGSSMSSPTGLPGEGGIQCLKREATKRPVPGYPRGRGDLEGFLL